MASRAKPTVTVPDGVAPLDLVIEDIEVGSGPEVVAGSGVAVDYVGVAWSTRGEFDSSWASGKPFRFAVGRGQVIAGWDQGLVGMRVGGRRRLTIPPHLGYGAAGVGPFIKGNETLVFVVDLIEVEPPSAAPATGRRRLFGRH
jgi:peptidylprolyl isomerase